MPTLLTDPPSALGGPSWLVEARESARSSFDKLGLPDSSEEVWRYSPIADLDLDRFGRARAAAGAGLGIEALATIEILAGSPSLLPELPEGLTATRLSEHPEGAALVSSALTDPDDSIVALNLALLGDGLVIDVARGARFELPLVLAHGAAGGASFSRTIVRLGDGSALSLVEHFSGGDAETLSVPVTELLVGDGAVLELASVQNLDQGAWHLATLAAWVGRDGTVSQLTAGLGGGYDRIRSDVALLGQGASSRLRSTYLGSGSQIHDLRTLQDHVAPRTISDLLCKGAVDDESRSVYSGVIKVRHGAVRADARQTNHNLVLSPAAHADSVPNLDIAENDVRCSHASTVGPLDEDQRYYLESRGITPAKAEELLVRGFFADLLERAPVRAAADAVFELIQGRLR